MTRAAKRILCVLSFVFCLGFAGYLVQGSNLQAPSSGTWVPTPGPMAEARTGAASAALPDGRVFVSGGTGASGALASVELFNPDGSFYPAAPMLAARSGHAAVALKDGRVLVAGGKDAAESPTSSAEIYDPLVNSWSLAEPMLFPRSGHTATLLDDGRVLIAGGETGSGPTQSLEIFDPASDSFALASEALLSPRMNHAAARLLDGRVLFVGGSDGASVLASAEVFDPAAEMVLPAAGLSVARAGHTATALLDGKVLVAGGNNGTEDLSSAEIYDPAGDTFAVASSALAAPRSGHLAFLLPHNNSVLIVGGTSGSAPVAGAELYLPWTGDFAATGSLAAARSGATGAPAVADGMLLVAGGSDGAAQLASGEVYGFATIKTDKDDYAPGETVTITGSGWEAGDDVMLVLHETLNPAPHGDRVWFMTADSSGNLFDNSFAPEDHDIGVRFYLTATGARSQAQMTFTDNPKVNSVSVGSQSAVITQGVAASVTYAITVTFGGSSATCNANVSFTFNGAPPTGASSSFSPTTVPSQGVGAGSSILTVNTTLATPAGSFPFTVTASNTGTGCNPTNASATAGGTLLVSQAPNITSANSTTFTVGTAGSFQVVATGSPVPTISFTGSLPTGVTLSSAGLLSGTPDSGTFGPYSINITATNGVSPNATQSFTLTVNKVTPAFTNLPASKTIVYGQSPISLSGKMTGYPSTPGPISINIDGVTNSSVLLNGNPNNFGPVSFNTSTISASAVPYPITYSFAGDGNNTNTSDASTTLTVNKANTTTTVGLIAPEPSNVNQSYTVNFSVAVVSPGGGTPDGTVTVDDGNGNTCLATLPATSCLLTSTSAGTKTVTASYSGSSNYNNSSGTSSHEVVNPDSDPPTINCTVPDQTVWYANDVTVNCMASDSGSGLANSGDASFSLTTSVSAGTETASAQTNSHQVCDNNSNCATAGPYTLKVDKKSPQQSVCDSADGLWHGVDVTLHCTYTDGGSGPASQQVSLTTSVSAGTETSNAIASAGGTQACDAVGNCASSPADITGNKIDKKAPTFDCTVPNQTIWYGDNVTVNCTASDGGSGLDNPADATFGLSTTVPADTETDSAATGTKALTDDVGNNVTAGPYTFKVDKRNPTITASATKADSTPYTAGTWTNQNVTVHFTCSDSGSGVATCPDDITVSAEGIDPSESATATDNAGNSANASFGPIKIDKTPPTITASATKADSTPYTAGTWTNQNVTVDFTCTDNAGGSGVASCPADVVLSSDGITTPSGTATDNAGNSASTSFGPVQIDKTPPTITITTPPNGATYLLNQAVAADYACEDQVGLSGVASCSGPVADGASIDTATVGSKNFTVNASDNAGNTASLTHTYKVQYNFVGFLQPVDNLPVINIANAGRTIPVKWQLKDANGTLVSDLGSLQSMGSNTFVCGDQPATIVEEQLASPGSTVFRFDGMQFIYNWQTLKNYNGCRLLQVTLKDGTQHWAEFKFK